MTVAIFDEAIRAMPRRVTPECDEDEEQYNEN